jgi:DNA-directed RNA polymerase subunit RPC12/RpoP
MGVIPNTCPKCGGNLKLVESDTVAAKSLKCPYCGFQLSVSDETEVNREQSNSFRTRKRLYVTAVVILITMFLLLLVLSTKIVGILNSLP